MPKYFLFTYGLFCMSVFVVALWHQQTEAQTLVFELPWISYKGQEVSKRDPTQAWDNKKAYYWGRWRGSCCACVFPLAVSIFVSISKWTLISWRQCCGSLRSFACSVGVNLASWKSLKRLCFFVRASPKQHAQSLSTWMDTVEFTSVCKIISVALFTSQKYAHNWRASMISL